MSTKQLSHFGHHVQVDVFRKNFIKRLQSVGGARLVELQGIELHILPSASLCEGKAYYLNISIRDKLDLSLLTHCQRIVQRGQREVYVMTIDVIRNDLSLLEVLQGQLEYLAPSKTSLDITYV